MAKKRTLGLSSASTISAINDFVSQNEGFLQGPLVEMGNDGKQSTFTFMVRGGRPKSEATISPLVSGKPNPPPGTTVFIENGRIFISGIITPSFASRA